MADAVMVAIVSAVGLVMSGVLVELVRSRRATGAVAGAADGIAVDVREIRTEQGRQGSRLAAVEARISDHLAAHGRR